jgi:hypothetical protein
MKPIASLSLDLDNRWSYLKTHGDASWESFPSYLDLVVPLVLDILQERDLTITFFIVGQDAAIESNGPVLRSIADAGHEIGNHSFHHLPWLHLYTEREIDDELRRADEAIERATGRRPIGFRGPGFSLSPATLDVLKNLGYSFDATTLPTWIGPLARAYYFRTAELDEESSGRRQKLFGTVRDVVRPIKPYTWDVGSGRLTEIPVTTMPYFRVPIHLSYVLYLSLYSPRLARLYFRSALWLCRVAGVAPSILMHPLDFLGGDEVPDLGFFPAMRTGGARKRERVAGYLDLFQRWFRVEPVGVHARESVAAGLQVRRLDG